MPTRDDLQFLLLQARVEGDPMRIEEQQSFARQLAVSDEQVHGLDILATPPDDSMLQDVHAVLVGGAGDFGVVHPNDAIIQLMEFLARTASRGYPLFASCFGFQALVKGLGGTVIEDHGHAEVGTTELSCTSAAARDSLFRNLPDHFDAQVGHKDRADRLPDGAINLVESGPCPHHAIHIEGTLAWATQFHPELTGEDNRRRFENYMDEYGILFGADEARARLNGCRPSLESNSLLRDFVELLSD